MGIKSTICLYRHTLSWGLKYPVPFGKKFSIMADYLRLYKTKGLEIEEYCDFEFEKRSEESKKPLLRYAMITY